MTHILDIIVSCERHGFREDFPLSLRMFYDAMAHTAVAHTYSIHYDMLNYLKRYIIES